MEPISADHPLRHLFAGLVEHSFCVKVGLCDPVLTGYLADLLVEFTRADRLRQIEDVQGKDLGRIAEALALVDDEQPADRVERDRAVYRHIGDFTLFWAGVYPEHLKRRVRNPTDVLLSYVSQGKRSYAIVSQLTPESDVLPASLFRHLSEDFEFCLHGLGLVRQGWESVETPGGDLVY